jgi:hypothetical protein
MSLKSTNWLWWLSLVFSLFLDIFFYIYHSFLIGDIDTFKFFGYHLAAYFVIGIIGFAATYNKEATLLYMKLE